MATKTLILVTLFCSFFAQIWAQNAFARSVEAEEVPFKKGEKLTYQLRWGVIPIGKAVLWVRNETEYKGRTVYHFSAEGRSNSFLSVFYKVDDLVQSFWDAESFQTLAFQKIQNEGRYHINEIYLFDPDRLKVTWLNSKRRVRKFDIPVGVQDAISCLYNFRRIGFGNKSDLKMDVHQDEKNYIFSVDSIRNEKVKVPALGRIQTVKVEPSAKHEGMFLRKGRMWVWFAQDEHRTPVIVKVKAPIFGKLTAVLIKIENELEPQPSPVAQELMAFSGKEI